jgi:hypothetical protein
MAQRPVRVEGAIMGSHTEHHGHHGHHGGDDDDDNPPCFARETCIKTNRGAVPVEALMEGDMVWTLENGYQPLRWVFHREVAAKGRFAPIRIKTGTLGATRDLLVSPAHRMLVQGAELAVLFGLEEAFVAAKDLVNGTTIMQEASLETVEYFHLLFDAHQVLEAHGTLSESFFPHAEAINGFGAEQKEELFALFPELAFSAGGFCVARPSLHPHEAALLTC